MKHLVLTLLISFVVLIGCAPSPAPPIVPEPPAAPTPTTVPTSAPVDIARPRTPITLAMGYIPSVQFAPFYVAQQNGYFTDAGLDVTFRYGFESDLLKLVGANELQFMIGSGEEVILGRNQGLPVRYVMRWYRKFPVVLFAKADKGIAAPADLIGKQVGLPGLFGASYVGWEAILYASKLDATQIRLQSIGFTQASAISQDQVDAAMDYIVNGPVQLRLAGQEVVVIPVSDFVDLPSNGIITNDQTIQERPELVRALVSAMMRGLADTLAMPDAAFEMSLAAVPEAGGAQTEVNRAIFDESLKLWQANKLDLGLSEHEDWAAAVVFMKDMGLIQIDLDPADLYTNEFVR